ncbi:MAG: phytanoyl-CoA dioxygenase family protein [Sphingomicrobium sp.]
MDGRLFRWLLAPLWIAQLATGAKSFVDNPVLGSRALNRWGLHAARLRAAHGLAWWRRRRLAAEIEADDRRTFDRDGVVCVPNFLPPDRFTRLRDALLTTPLEARDHRQGSCVTRRFAIDDTLVASIPELRDLIGSRRWKGLIRYVASTGGEPLYHLQSILSGLDGPPDPQLTLHSDTFHPSLKAWFFLTDVAVDEGPLTYVPGSHLLTDRRLAWEKKMSEEVLDRNDRLSQRGSFRVTEADLAGMGLAPPRRFAVPANTLVVADTFGFHARGNSVRPSVRVELWAYRRRSPFLPWTGFNLLSLPGFALRRVRWAYRLTDWLDRRGWWHQQWTPVGSKLALDRSIELSKGGQ